MTLSRLLQVLLLFSIPVISTVCLGAQRKLGVRPTDSGGPLSTEQASYDVLHYDLRLRIDPELRRLDGSVTVTAKIVQPLSWFVLDLDSALTVGKVTLLETKVSESKLEFERRPTQIWIRLPHTRQPGDNVRLSVEYGGVPRVAPRPPWVGGFTWSKTRDGSPWVAVSCQLDGADLWWPVKDHPSDEPDSMDLRFTVPAPLLAASNGTLQEELSNPDGTRTFHWHVSNPINAYNVTVNIAPYRLIAGSYSSISGEQVPTAFWVLPEHYDKALELVSQIPLQLRFLEEKLGPYPFRNEKYGVAEVPYLGMEHQTIIAYGSNFENNKYGFDWLHFHELAHEWWGNLVSVPDWRDHWIHEGLASYMEALYAEELKGEEGLLAYMNSIRSRIRNLSAVAPRESQTMVQRYFVPPDFTESDGDVNFKAAWILHTLRYVIGDSAFLETLRRFSYPNPEWEKPGSGCRCRFATTDDFQHLAEKTSGRDLSWFFALYFRQPELPLLKVRRKRDRLELEWQVPRGLSFPMPVPVRIGDRTALVPMEGGRARVAAGTDETVEIDPDEWVLKAPKEP